MTLLPLVGRVLVAAIFIWSGLHKLMAPGRAAALIAAHGLPLATAGAVAAGLLEVVAGAALVLGVRSRAVAIALGAYVVLVTWLFHYPGQMVEVMKNAAIVGALLLVAANGPGSLSVDRG